MTVKLTELYNTRYFYVTFSTDLNYLMQTVQKVKENPEAQIHCPSKRFGEIVDSLRRGEELVLDTASARFTKDITPILLQMQRNGITLTDSEIPWRAALYEENSTRNAAASMPELPLPELPYSLGIREYITSLSKDIVYTPRHMDQQLQCAIVTAVITARPSVQISDRFLTSGLFQYVQRYIPTEALSFYTKFIAMSNEGVRVLDFSKGTSVFVQGYGYIDLATAIARVPMIPAAFGERVVVRDPNFELLIRKSLNTINLYQQSRKKTLSEVLLGQQEDRS